MKIEYKIFIVITCLFLSIPFLFFSWSMITLEYKEVMLYGNLEDAVVMKTTIEPYTGVSGQFGSDYRYDLKLLTNKHLEDKNYSAYVERTNSSLPNQDYEEFINNVKQGDTVQIKIVSERQAKILKWKHLTLNKPINYWERSGNWVIIIVLLAVATFLYYKIYKIIKK